MAYRSGQGGGYNANWQQHGGGGGGYVNDGSNQEYQEYDDGSSGHHHHIPQLQPIHDPSFGGGFAPEPQYAAGGGGGGGRWPGADGGYGGGGGGGGMMMMPPQHHQQQQPHPSSNSHSQWMEQGPQHFQDWSQQQPYAEDWADGAAQEQQWAAEPEVTNVTLRVPRRRTTPRTPPRRPVAHISSLSLALSDAPVSRYLLTDERARARARSFSLTHTFRPGASCRHLSNSWSVCSNALFFGGEAPPRRRRARARPCTAAAP